MELMVRMITQIQKGQLGVLKERLKRWWDEERKEGGDRNGEKRGEISMMERKKQREEY